MLKGCNGCNGNDRQSKMAGWEMPELLLAGNFQINTPYLADDQQIDQLDIDLW